MVITEAKKKKKTTNEDDVRQARIQRIRLRHLGGWTLEETGRIVLSGTKEPQSLRYEHCSSRVLQGPAF